MQYETMLYSAPAEVPNETNDCFVRSLSVAFGMPYKAAHALCKKNGRKNGQGTSYRAAISILEHLKAEPGNNKLTGTYDDFDWHRQKRIQTFLREHPTGVYVVLTLGHAYVVKDGVIHDWESRIGNKQLIYTWFKIPTTN